jgi:hypothetical protein
MIVVRMHARDWERRSLNGPPPNGSFLNRLVGERTTPPAGEGSVAQRASRYLHPQQEPALSPTVRSGASSGKSF